MNPYTHAGLQAVAVAVLCAAVPTYADAPDDERELRSKLDAALDKIAQMDAKIATLEAHNDQSWLTEERSTEIKGLVQDVLADADTRASLLQSGMTSGYDNGFILSSTDGNWLLKTNFLMQQRFIYSSVDDDPAGIQDHDTYGFENTRSKFMMHGHIVNPDWFYWIDTNLGTGGATTSVLYANSGDRTGVGNAYLGYNYGNGFKFTMGSFKDPFLREDMVNAEYQLAVERSNLNYNFTTGYVDGLMATFEADQLRVYGNFTDGANSGQLTWNTVDTDYAFTARGEFMFSGTWEQFRDFTSPKGSETGILVGAAMHWERGEYGTLAPETEVFEFTGDVSAEFGGFNLYGAFIWSDVSVSAVPGSGNPWGFVVQGGFYLDQTWELYARYEWADYDVSPAVVDDLSALTFGVNKYFHGHNAKWTTDFGWGINSVQAASNITGWVNDPTNDEDGEMVLRTQMQILF
jgi:hypothetical protein